MRRYRHTTIFSRAHHKEESQMALTGESEPAVSIGQSTSGASQRVTAYISQRMFGMPIFTWRWN